MSLRHVFLRSDWSSGAKVSDQAMRLLDQLKQVAQSKQRDRNKNLWFTMRLLYADSDVREFSPKGFTTKEVSKFEVRGKSQAQTCGHIDTRFGSFRLKAETNVTVHAE